MEKRILLLEDEIIVALDLQEILDAGLKEGDVIVFEPHSEYEFRIDGEKLYRMYTKNLLIKLNEQDNGVKETNN